MEVDVAGTTRYAEVRFDPWAGLVATDLRVPDLAEGNRFVIRQFVANMSVDSNMSADTSPTSLGVTNETGIRGYLEIWPWDYGTGVDDAGPSGGDPNRYDFNDSPTMGNSYGSFQVHKAPVAGGGSTVLAWNDHNNSTPDIGIGNSTSGHPDWTFTRAASLGTTNWKLTISVETTQPITATG
jgi:hypothetical protein